MSGRSLLKRTRGVQEFEFVGIIEAMARIEQNKLIRENKRRMRLKLEKRNKDAIKAAENNQQVDQDSDNEVENELNMFDDEPKSAKLPQVIGDKQTNVLLTISGWISNGHDDFTLPYSTLVANKYGDHYSLIWESKELQELGSALKILGTEVAGFLFQQGLQLTVLPILMAGLTGPLWALKLTYLMDNPWGIALSKAERTGRVLADSLINQVQGIF